MKRLFWILFTATAAACTWFSIHYFTRAFPIANLTITMSRAQAMEAARCAADTLHLGPAHRATTASLEDDAATQKYVELASGGSDAFNAMITGTLYAPYTWHVRLFEENNPHEVKIFFKPTGQIYGFVEKISETTPGAALTGDQARIIAERDAQAHWAVALTEYQLIESAQEKKPNGRVDHTFTYERPGIRIGADGTYRLKLSITGDKLTQVRHFVKVPESFFQWYSQLRASNELIHQLASVAFLLLYLILGCYVGLLLLARQRRLQWRGPLIWALLLATSQAIIPLNELPLAWMQYDTATHSSTFLFEYFATILIEFLKNFLIILLPAMAVAEALTRTAFAQHLQFWKLWTLPTGNSYQLLGRTIGGYLMVSVDMAVLVTTYLITRTYCGWKIPSDPLADPNILAAYIPWLSAACRSFYAGFWEEFVFRAVPLAGAALLGDRFGKRKLFLFAGMILQAIIFGGAHANYATLPGYARLLELIVPSLVFGFLYLRFGLLVPIIAHATYDLVLMGLPLFLSQAQGAWVGQLCLIAWAFIPLWVVLYFRYQQGTLVTAPAESYNSAWQPEAASASTPQDTSERTWSNTHKLMVYALALTGAAAWLISFKWKSDAPALGTQAAAQAHATHLTALPTGWRQLAKARAEVDAEHRFVWQTAGPAQYAELMQRKFLMPPLWIVRYATFEGDLQSRAEEYRFLIDGTNSALRIWHKLPETHPGAALSAQEARALAIAALAQRMPDVDTQQLTEISATSEKRPLRTDWNFVFQTSSSLPHGHTRIGVTVSGDQVTDLWKFIHIPEAWQRADRNNQAIYTTIAQLSQTVLFILCLALVLYALATMQCAGPIFWNYFLLMLVLGGALYALKFPVHAFTLNANQNVSAQWVTRIAGFAWQLIRESALTGVIFGFIASQAAPALNYSAYGSALAVGTLLAAVAPFLRFATPCPQPWFPLFEGADGNIPWLCVTLLVVYQFLLTIGKFLAAFWAARKMGTYHWSLSWITLIMFGFALGAKPAGLMVWALTGTITSAALISGFYMGITSARLVGTMVLTSLTLFAVQEAALNIFPGAAIGYALGCALCLILLSRIK